MATSNTLIIEDDIAIQLVIAGVAEKKGHKVTVCGSAEEGQKAWKEKHFPLVILDLNLPGIGGLDFCKWLRKQKDGNDTFVVVSTSDTKVETFKNVLAAGANDYIMKPLHPQMLTIRLDVAESQAQQIQKKRELEKKSKQDEKRFRLLSENSRDLICTHNQKGIITYISPSAKNLLGYEQEELLEKSFDVLKIDPKAETININCGEDEENGQLETTNTWKARHKNGGEVWLETYTQVNKDDLNTTKEIYSYSRDVTAQKDEEHQLKILSVLGEGNDCETFIKTMAQEIAEKMKGTACIHVHATNPEQSSYWIESSNATEKEVVTHRSLNKNTTNNKPIYQPRNAAGVFNQIENIDAIESVIVQPIPGTYGKPIGKLTIVSHHPFLENERTKTILLLCATKLGCVIEDHLNK